MMAHLPPCLAVCLALLVFFSDPARVAAQAETTPREYADIFKGIPQQSFLKLRGPDKEQGAMELSKSLASEVGRSVPYRVKVGKIDSLPLPREGITG